MDDWVIFFLIQISFGDKSSNRFSFVLLSKTKENIVVLFSQMNIS